MGDRTFAEVVIHEYYYKQHKKELDKIAKDDLFEIEPDEDQIRFKDYEANYGSLEPLEMFLAERKIEYDKYWEDGGDYEAGQEVARIINGKYTIHEISRTGVTLKDEFKSLFALKDNPKKMLEQLEKKINQLEPFEVEPLSCPQSIQFIKEA